MKNAVSRIVSKACPSCGGASLSTRTEIDRFTYGLGDNAVDLSSEVAVHACQDCGGEFTDDDAEDRRHAAVCKHLGVMSPSEIRELRTRNNMSRSEFAKLTHIGEATIARWERGSLIQNAGYDQLLRLLQYPDNLLRLHQLDCGNPSDNITPIAKFRYITRTPELELARKSFRLQRAKV